MFTAVDPRIQFSTDPTRHNMDRLILTATVHAQLHCEQQYTLMCPGSTFEAAIT